MPLRRSVPERRAQKAALDREIKEGRHAVLIVNTRSRSGARIYSEAKRLLAESGIALDAAYPIRYPERMVEIVREEIAKGRKFIIVGGGDGSISSVIGEFAYTDVVFGLLPLGTANSFARTLGIPLDIAGAIDVLVNGKVADIDLAMIGDAYFANGSSIGMPAIVGRATPHNLKRLIGRGAYAFVAAGKFVRYAPFGCTVTINGKKTTFKAFDVRIVNGGFQGGVLVDSDASPDDGRIAIHILRGPSKWALAREWARLALGVPFGPADIEILTASELTIDTVPKQHVAVDGEVITQTPIRVSVAREALLLMAPTDLPQLEDQEP
ncbi:diacylglycerol kinase [Sphingomonas sp. A2-49]|uniref:diacylglycerol/lipid kinase family protein n=1 Tax=Sphingomonas sp. A2-49 TaxID=1391375 RepID=UPI0021D3CD51|nr:diacylglycerol kinase family protein [Sphingomonas sp. A2-49]MCU6453392.1 diacylglycerol kinase [Sphingomonas sp. A2-49]